MENAQNKKTVLSSNSIIGDVNRVIKILERVDH